MKHESGIRDEPSVGSSLVRLLGAVAALAVVLPFAPDLDGQELLIRRDLPTPVATNPCAGQDGSRSPASPEARTEAEALVREATEAMILGDTERARSRLSTAASLDPSSPSIQLRLGRLLEDLGQRELALEAFCLALVLEPAGPDGAAADEGVRRLAVRSGGRLSDEARAAFREGVERFDAADYEAADRLFSLALDSHPDWAEARLNRGIARLRIGRRSVAHADLERYLELRPGADEAALIRAELGPLTGAPTRPASRTASQHSPAAAMALGLVVPGMGHFYSGRSRTGTMYLLGAGLSVVAGFSYTEVEVLCLLDDAPQRCPPDSIVGERRSQPYLVPGLVGAAVITVVGAVHALVSTQRAGEGLRMARSGPTLRWTVPGSGFREGTTVVRLDPVITRDAGGMEITLQLRF
jgi:tetratricopeptide (TPR) repeat protein